MKLMLCIPYYHANTGHVGGKRTLVLLDSLEIKDTHSLFFSSLEERGHVLTYKLADSSDLQLLKYGEYIYDNIIHFASAAEEIANLDFNAFTAFVEGVSQ